MGRLDAVSLNCKGSLVPREAHESLEGHLNIAAALVRGRDFMCLQEVGVAGDVTPPVLRKAFDAEDCVVFVHGALSAEDQHSMSGVALVINRSWVPKRVWRHSSGRAIAALVSRGQFEMVVVSVYMPTGMDTASESSDVGLEKRMLCRALYEFVAQRVAGHDVYLVGGDFNETRLGCLDRLIARKSGESVPGAASPREGCLMEGFLGEAGSGCVDVYRHLHPGEIGYTFRRIGGDPGVPFDERPMSRSRLDYWLAPGRLFGRKDLTWSFEVLPYFKDHAPVGVRLESSGGLIPSAPSGRREAWDPGHPRIGELSEAEVTRVVRDCDKSAAELLARWKCVSLRKRSVAWQRRWLDRGVRSLLRRLREGAQAGCSKSVRAAQRREVLSRLDRARALVGLSDDVRHLVREVRRGERTPGDPRFCKVAGRMQAILGFSPGDVTDVDVWAELAEGVKTNRKILLRKAASQSQGYKAGHDDLHRTFYEQKDLGRFIEEYLRPQSARGHALDRVTVDGKVLWSPEEYKPVVADRVSAPMREAVPFAPRTVVNPPVVDGDEFPSTDARATGGRPFWWRSVYNRQAKSISADVFAGLMRKVSVPEFRATIASSKAGTSPGHDGVGIDLIKMLVDRERLLKGGESNVLLAMLFIVNQCLRLGHIPPFLKLGWITMIPKVKADGSFSLEAENMRPITVLPALGKLVTKGLTDRANDVLVAHPDIMDSAQRAFLKDGYLAQCLDVVVDVFEDWNESKRGRSPLFAISYDQKKAYDSVNRDTLRASLERFNVPERFIDIVLSGLEDAYSCVRTHGGLTDRFKLGSSVRQGDPLSPLVFAMVMDALHCGFRQNPLFPTADVEKWGYEFAHAGLGGGDRVCVRSVGYADDTILCAESPKALAQMHCWMREWYGANFFAFNTTKTKLLCSDPALAPPIPSVDGKDLVRPLPAGESIRYLGLMINLNLDWTAHVAGMDKAVWALCHRIREYKFDLVQSAYAVRQYLVPRLRIGLEMAGVPLAMVEGWDTRIRRACLAAAGMSMGPLLTAGAFYLGSGVPRLGDEGCAVRTEELVVRLNASFPSSATAWARFGGSLQGPHGPGNRAARTVQEAQSRFDVRVARRPQGSMVDPRPELRVVAPSDIDGPGVKDETVPLLCGGWLPHLRPRLVVLTGATCAGGGADPEEVHLYTDGSTGRDHTMPTGCSVVRPSDPSPVEYGFACPRGGDNFSAELAALVAALQAVPSHVRLVVHTDSAAVIGAVNRGRARDWEGGGFLNTYALSQRRRILSACRPLLNCARALISARLGAVGIVKVKAHSGRGDCHSQLNDVADGVANRARIAATMRRFPPRNLAGEVGVGVWLPNRRGPGRGASVIGSFRRALLRRAEQLALESIGKRPHQGRLARACGGRLTSAFRAVRRCNSPDLTAFFMEAATEFLPVEARTDVRHGSLSLGPGCKLCGAEAETCAHALGQCRHASLASRVRDTLARAKAVVMDGRRARGARVGGPADGAACARTRALRAWWDPSGGTVIQVPDVLSPKQLGEVARHPPLAGFLGVHPPYVDVLLRRPGDDLKAVQDRMARLRRVLVWGAMSVWSARSRAMNDLLDASDSSGFVEVLARRRTGRRRRVAEAAASRRTTKFAQRRPLPGGAVPSSRPQRSFLARALAVRFGCWESTPTFEEQLDEERVHLLRRGEVRFPRF